MWRNGIGGRVALERLRGYRGQVKDVLCVVPPVTLSPFYTPGPPWPGKGRLPSDFSHTFWEDAWITFSGMGEPAGGGGGVVLALLSTSLPSSAIGMCGATREGHPVQLQRESELCWWCVAVALHIKGDRCRGKFTPVEGKELRDQEAFISLSGIQFLHLWKMRWFLTWNVQRSHPQIQKQETTALRPRKYQTRIKCRCLWRLLPQCAHPVVKDTEPDFFPGSLQLQNIVFPHIFLYVAYGTLHWHRTRSKPQESACLLM